MDNYLARKSKELRKNPTDTESLAKKLLHSSGERPVRRQYVIGRYIVDLALPCRNLVIEIDGEYHQTQIEKDQKRDIWLEDEGFNVLRVSNHELSGNPELFLDKVQSYPASGSNRVDFFTRTRDLRKLHPWFLPK